MRIDAAGYQAKIVQYCDDQGIEYAIRAKTSDTTLRAQIEAASESDWQPLLDKQGEAISGQASLELDSENNVDERNIGGYVYRAMDLGMA